MAFFFSEMDEVSKVIFYMGTSWLLFLIIIFLKKILKGRKGDEDSTIGR
ncbi:hypothetical protein SAMN05216232_3492 [Virgibacillus subterraneus]|uniref:Uncharacterized protein n=2 Tax=Virgibacillus TaxID=84406 RepID=A0A1H1GB41_9BACI|nr:hypothetical protein SAMN05216231_3616 [Virgibacillus salinus]SEQ84596.1 hypothetical protein SAMN05216232_3492 [Virgibacillus subterraneus]